MTKKPSLPNRKKVSHLEFSTQDQVAIAARDYGLMRTSTKAQTPYPHVDPGVDANLLKARLSMRRHFEIKQSEISGISKDKIESYHTMKTTKSALTASLKSVHMNKQLAGSESNFKTLLSTGTPHPTKSVALNAKALSTRLTDVNLKFAQPSSPTAEDVPRSRIKKVRLMDASTVIMIQPDTTLDSERLSDVSLRVTRLDYSVANSHLSVSSVSSFAERRRLFDEGEYTIARKGKKMGDMMMAYTTLEKRLADHTTQFAKKAKEEIEKYIKAQGLIKTSNDQLKWSRQFDLTSQETSSDSMQDNTHIVVERYRNSENQKGK
ncbi:uncharacterized protein LOC110188542 [Drosophila serrata]|uniref:uncharacterized protein LOC110188542 n=1 Tax=Drosophila serrata TaxID=7274 RepID=UPI000A1D3899|nr:uncharacterized protein LOC110188542 [Drosophila serrata]